MAVGAGIGLAFSSTLVRPIRLLLQDIRIVAAGDLDHVTKSHSADEFGMLARSFHAMTRSLKRAQEAAWEAKARDHELKIATEIQSNLLPSRVPRPPGWDVGAYYRPSREVGGDYYDFIPIDAGHLGIVVADVSGKGIPGSMVMTMFRSLLRMEAESNLSAAAVLVRTNRTLARDIRRGMFVTCCYGILDLKSPSLLVASAGHNPLVVVRQADRTRELVNPNGIALGLDRGALFERTIKEQRVPLRPGDRLVFYTDGVVESMNPRDREFGDERFFEMCTMLAGHPSNELIARVVRALDAHQSTGPQHDDITLVTARLVPE
jgi:sigma-B regulation protein RsbU (phosphoserine phosphatase)